MFIINNYIDGYGEKYIVTRDSEIFNTNNNKNICKWVDNVGYYQVRLYLNGKKKSYRLHRLIAEKFIDNPYELPFVNHKDGNKLNNDLSNLEWCDNATNTQHGYDNKLYKFKNRSYNILVYDKDSNFIKQFKSIRSLSEELNLNRKTVTSILNGLKTNNYEYIFEYGKNIENI